MEHGATTYKPQSDYKKKTNQPKEDGLSNFVFGKVQPQAIPLEEAVLGALLLDKNAVVIVMEILKPESFYTDAHQNIYRAVLDLYRNSRPIDLLTVTEQLKTDGNLEKVGGGYYLVEISNRVASAANIEYHARIIEQKHIQRQLIHISTETIRQAYEDSTDVFELQDAVDTKLFAIRSFSNGGKVNTTTDLGRLVLENLVARQQHKGLVGVPTGIYDLDQKIGGYQNSDLVIVAARPGMGKTAYVISVMLNAALTYKKKIGFFSLEMSPEQIGNRMVAQIADIDLEHMKNGKLEDWQWDKIGKAIEKLDTAEIYVDDTAAISVMDLRTKARMMKTRYGVDMVVIDYLQLMTGGADKSGNREREIATISRSLKQLAKELNIPVVALAQLSRAVETRGGSKRPQLSDLRESGAIENDADVIQFLYRPEYYQITEDAHGNSLKGIAEIITSKHRNGSLSTIQAKFTDYCAKYSYLSIKPGESFPTGDYDPNEFIEPDKDVFQPGVIANQARMNDEDIPF